MNIRSSVPVRPLWLLLLQVAIVVGIREPAAGEPPTVAASPGSSLVDAGTLLTKEEVAVVQGCAISRADSSNGKSGEYCVTQCYYAADEPDKSVSLALMQTDPDDPAHRTARQLWHQTFDRYSEPDGDEEEREKKKEKGKTHELSKKEAGMLEGSSREKEKDEHENPPRRIEHLGDEAYWTSNQMGGVLYVLRGQMFLRISVGGRDQPEEKLDKSKALAQRALARM